MAETIDILISEDEVEKRVRELAEKISADYEGREVCLVGILKGACFFMCDLAKRISVPVTIDFMQASSYGGATESSGTVRIKKDVAAQQGSFEHPLLHTSGQTGETRRQPACRLCRI